MCNNVIQSILCTWKLLCVDNSELKLKTVNLLKWTVK